MSVLDQPHYHDEDAARAWLEQLMWPKGVVCSHCGDTGRAYRAADTGSHRGRCRCANPACRKDLSVTTGTVMERSHVPLHKWLTAAYLMSSSGKGVSAHQLHRTLGVTYKTAWFLAHRLREAMEDGGIIPLGGEGKTVEADETYHGQKDDPAERKKPGQRGPAGKRPIAASVERGGKARTFHVASADKETVEAIVRQNVARESRLMTDESRLYDKVGAELVEHGAVMHGAGEYVRGDAHTDTLEGFFSIFKRGMRGIHRHCRERHPHRCLAEFEFRYDYRIALDVDDEARTVAALESMRGKRLLYRDSSWPAPAQA